MKKNITKILIIFIAITSITIFTNSCYDDDGDAVVTIHLERNDLAAMGIKPDRELSIVDKILNFFSTRAEAGTTDWNGSISNLTLTVSSNSFEDKQFTIPTTATTFTTTLPSGDGITLTITSETEWNFLFSNIQKNWGGQLTTSLTPGKQDLLIQMKPMTFIYVTPLTAPKRLQVSWIISNIPSYVTSYKIYRSTEINRNFKYLATVNSTLTIYDDSSITLGTTYYYRVSTDGTLGEGVMSDVQSGVQN